MTKHKSTAYDYRRPILLTQLLATKKHPYLAVMQLCHDWEIEPVRTGSGSVDIVATLPVLAQAALQHARKDMA